MAYDKVVDSAWLEAGLKKVCDAIRVKTGGTADLAFPDEMESAILNISTVNRKTLSSYAVGDSVFLNEGGVAKEYIVVNQGNPDATLYDASCDGTWLMRKYTLAYAWGPDNDYENNTIHTNLNTVHFSLFDSKVQAAIKEVKIPYYPGSTPSTSAVPNTLENGLSTKVFLASIAEIGLPLGTLVYANPDGTLLDYFIAGDSEEARSLRSATSEDGSVGWSVVRTGSPMSYNRYIAVVDGVYGGGAYMGTGDKYCLPVIIMPGTTKFDGDTNEFISA